MMNKINVRYTRPYLYPKQKEAIFNDSRFAFIEASSKAGKTVGCITWLFEKALQGKSGQHFWWIAPVYPQAKIAFDRLKRTLPSNFYTSNETDLKIVLKHGAIISFKSADKINNLYGEDVYAIVVDEASRTKGGLWLLVRSLMTKTRGQARFIGNVQGKLNWFYVKCREAEEGKIGYSYSKITIYDAVAGGVLSQEEADDLKASTSEAEFRELYLAEAVDSSGGMVKEAWFKYYTQRPAFNEIYQSWDTAVKTNETNDYSVCLTWGVLGNEYYLLDCYRNKVVFPDLVAKARQLASQYNPRKIIIEDKSSGQQLIQDLRRNSNLPIIAENVDRDKGSRLAQCSFLIESGRVHLPKDGVFVKSFMEEMLLFPNGFHDDLVDATTLFLNYVAKPKNVPNIRIL
jgi:predicted phage terminase large subunit-like protein